MLRDAGATLTIVGHSERRDAQHESDEEVRAKAEAALAAGLDVILCVGESMPRAKAGRRSRLARQLDGRFPLDPGPAELAIAYEPIWAIGSGKIPSMDGHRARCMPRCARGWSRPIGERRRVRILYGGSVKARTPLKYSRSPTSTAHWSAAPA